MLAIVIDARDNWKSTVPRVGKRLPDLMARLLRERGGILVHFLGDYNYSELCGLRFRMKGLRGNCDKMTVSPNNCQKEFKFAILE